MRVFLRLEPSSLVFRPWPLKRFYYLKILSEERCKKLINVGIMQEALEKVHQDAHSRSERRSTRARLVHNAKTNILPLNIEVGDYVLIRTHAMRNHKLQAKWRRPMKIFEANSSLAFIVESIVDKSRMNVDAQHILPYPISTGGEQASAELKKQAGNYDTPYHLVENVCGIRKKENE